MNLLEKLFENYTNMCVANGLEPKMTKEKLAESMMEIYNQILLEGVMKGFTGLATCDVNKELEPGLFVMICVGPNPEKEGQFCMGYQFGPEEQIMDIAKRMVETSKQQTIVDGTEMFRG